MPEELLPCVEVEPDRPAECSVLWLHGLGADGHDFESIVPELGLDDLAVRFVFPHAPVIPVTINGGMRMRAWYDILEMDIERRVDEAGVRRSAAAAEALLAREQERGIPPERTLLAGFSQGGAVALHLGLRREEPLAGLVLLSTYLVLRDSVEAEASEASRALPVFQSHGTYDPIVPCSQGELARDALLGRGNRVEWSAWPMEHQVCLEEIEALGAWMRGALAAGA